jgi:hypothetical protein
MFSSWWTYLSDWSYSIGQDIVEGVCRGEANGNLECAIDLGEDLQEDDSATDIQETCELGVEDAIVG